MQTLLVTAHLCNGFAASDPWSPALDGILGYWLMRERLGSEEFFLQAARPDLREPCARLPVATVEHGEQWWYACSMPLYQTQREFLHYFHRRFDAQAAERYMVPPRGRTNTKAGPYKAFRLYERVRLMSCVQWHVIGDGDEIGRLLRRCSHIGAKASQGRGRVARWEVDTAAGSEHMARQLRPLPVEYAAAHGIDGYRIDWGIRPPVRDHVTDCIIPEAA